MGRSVSVGRSRSVGRSVRVVRVGRTEGRCVNRKPEEADRYPPTHPPVPPSLPSLPTPTPNLPLTRRARWTSRVLYEACVCPRRAALPAACAACLLRAAALTQAQHLHGTRIVGCALDVLRCLRRALRAYCVPLSSTCTSLSGTCTARASSAARCSCASHSTGAAFFICETRSGLERNTLITRPLTRHTLLFSLLLSSLDLQPNPN